MRSRSVTSLCLALAVPATAQEPDWSLLRFEAVRDLHVRAGRIEAVALSPTADLVASVGELGDVAVHTVPTGREIARFEIGTAHRDALAFSPDGLSLAATGDRLWIWHRATGLARAFAGSVAPRRPSWSADASRLAWVATGGTVAVADFDDGALSAPRSVTTEDPDRVLAIALSPAGDRVAVGGPGGVSVFDTSDGTLTGRPVFGEPVRRLDWGSDGRIDPLEPVDGIVDRSADGSTTCIADGPTLRIRNGEAESEIHPGHVTPLVDAALTGDGRFAVLHAGPGPRLSSAPPIRRAFRVDGGEPVAVDGLPTHGALVRGSTEPHLVLANLGERPATLETWSLGSGRSPVRILSRALPADCIPGEPPLRLAYWQSEPQLSGDGRFLAIGDALVDLSRERMTGNPGPLSTDTIVSPDGRYIAVLESVASRAPPALRVQDADGAAVLRTELPEHQPVHRAAFTADGSHLLIATSSHVHRFDARAWREVEPLPHAWLDMHRLPHGEFLAIERSAPFSRDDDSALCVVWSPTTGTVVARSDPVPGARQLRIAADGRTFLTVHDTFARVWRLVF